jgi:hypothetical protein
MDVGSAPPAEVNCWAGTVVFSLFRGSWMQYLVKVGEVELSVWSSDHSIAPGSQVWIKIAPEHVMVRSAR